MEQKKPGLYLTEGGTETEIMYKHGFELPEFATYPLLDDEKARAALYDMFRRYLDVAAGSGWLAMLGGLDYRASPDWAGKLGYSAEGLREMQGRCIDFLRDVAKPYAGDIPDIRITGVIGPRGDAYSLSRTISANEAEDYHSVQLENLRQLDVDMAWAATFNNVPEAVGLARAASRIGVPVCISFTLTSDHRLHSGDSLKEAVLAVDELAGEHRPHSFGINCSHPLEFAPAIEAGDWFLRVRNIRPNAALMDKVALCSLGHLEEGDPVELGRQLGELAARFAHIDMWGGCCGTWDVHLREIAEQVSAASTNTPADNKV